jgi:hypothetical protein
MKNRIIGISGMDLLARLTAIAALCIALPARAGLPYPSASTVSQLIADINYANNAGGAITINLAPGASFDLNLANTTTTDGGIGLPVIGGTKAVALTIIGNGDTIKRIAAYSRKSGYPTNPFRLFDVAPGASLTLDHVTLQGAWGSAILNQGTLNVINGSTLFDTQGSGIFNSGGIVTVSNSTLSRNYGGIVNSGGTVTVSNSTLSDNQGSAISNGSGTVTVSNSTLSDNAENEGGGIHNNAGAVTVSNSTLSNNDAEFGGGIYNDSNGTVTVENSTLTNNVAFFDSYANPGFGGAGGGIYNNAGTVTVSNSILSGNALHTGDPEMIMPFPTGLGAGIYNDVGTVKVENSSSITGNIWGADVVNSGVLYLDSTSTIGFLDGNSAMPF